MNGNGILTIDGVTPVAITQSPDDVDMGTTPATAEHFGHAGAETAKRSGLFEDEEAAVRAATIAVEVESSCSYKSNSTVTGVLLRLGARRFLLTAGGPSTVNRHTTVYTSVNGDLDCRHGAGEWLRIDPLDTIGRSIGSATFAVLELRPETADTLSASKSFFEAADLCGGPPFLSDGVFVAGFPEAGYRNPDQRAAMPGSHELSMLRTEVLARDGIIARPFEMSLPDGPRRHRLWAKSFIEFEGAGVWLRAFGPYGGAARPKLIGLLSRYMAPIKETMPQGRLLGIDIQRILGAIWSRWPDVADNVREVFARIHHPFEPPRSVLTDF